MVHEAMTRALGPLLISESQGGALQPVQQMDSPLYDQYKRLRQLIDQGNAVLVQIKKSGQPAHSDLALPVKFLMIDSRIFSEQVSGVGVMPYGRLVHRDSCMCICGTTLSFKLNEQGLLHVEAEVLGFCLCTIKAEAQRQLEINFWDILPLMCLLCVKGLCA